MRWPLRLKENLKKMFWINLIRYLCHQEQCISPTLNSWMNVAYMPHKLADALLVTTSPTVACDGACSCHATIKLVASRMCLKRKIVTYEDGSIVGWELSTSSQHSAAHTTFPNFGWSWCRPCIHSHYIDKSNDGMPCALPHSIQTVIRYGLQCDLQ